MPPEPYTFDESGSKRIVDAVLWVERYRNIVGKQKNRRLPAVEFHPAGVNPQAGTTYTLTIEDEGNLVTFNNAAAKALTLPQPTAGGDFDLIWCCDTENTGAGDLVITPTSSTIDGLASLRVPENEGCRLFVGDDGTGSGPLNWFTQRGMTKRRVYAVARCCARPRAWHDPIKIDNVKITKAVFTEITLPTTKPGSPADGDIWVVSPGCSMYYQCTPNGGSSSQYWLMKNPMLLLGDIIYGDASGSPTRLPGNTDVDNAVLRSKGTGSAAQAPDWFKFPGELLASLFTATAENTASGSYTDLATVDTVTFTLGAAADVYIVYLALTNNTNATVTNFNEAYIDGALDSSSEAQCTVSVANAIFPCSLTWKVSLASGSHTIKIQHKTNAGTATWRNRLLEIVRA